MADSIDIETPGSPGWWLNTLAVKLHERRIGREGRKRFVRNGVESSQVRPGLELLSDYLRGDPPLREDVHSGWAAPFRQFLRMGRMSVAPLMVSSTTNRMGIRDFRTAAADDDLGDEQARRLMRANDLKLKAREVHDLMLGLGDGYTIITPPDARRSHSLITAESPMQCITAHDPATGETLAGLKMFRDEWDAADWAYLHLPGELWVARADVPSSTLFGKRGFALSKQWTWDVDKFDDIPGNEVAMVRFQNKDGVSEIEGHLNHLDRINDKLFNEWWIGKLQAHRQRALEMPDDEDGESELDDLDDEDLAGIFTSAPDAMWQLPKGAKIWESSAADLRQLVDSIKAELQWLAAVSSNPLHTITPDAAQGSAEGASLQREQNVYKAEDRRDRAEGRWARTVGMAFRFQGDTVRADHTQIEAMWAPIERYSLSEKASAASQLRGILPWESIATDVMQYSPGDVSGRLRSQRATDVLFLPPSASGQ